MFNRDSEPPTSNNNNSSNSGHYVWPPRSPLSARDRFFDQSGDDAIQKLRDQFEQQRQMFFDRLGPQWDTATAHRGFPFTDTPRRFGVDRTHFPHFDDAEVWVEDGDGAGRDQRQRRPSSGSGRSASSTCSSDNGSNPAGCGMDATRNVNESCAAHESPRLRKAAARSATGDFPTLSNDSDHKKAEGVRGFRASSAPPMNCSTSANHSSKPAPTSAAAAAPPTAAAAATAPASGANDHRHKAGDHGAARGKDTTSANVRHIPIFVEERDEHILPRVVEEDNQPKMKANDCKRTPTPSSVAAAVAAAAAAKLAAKQQAAERMNENAIHKKPIPMPFYSTATDQSKNKGNSSPSEQPMQSRDPSAAIPLPFPTDLASSRSSNCSSSSLEGEGRPTDSRQIPIPMPYPHEWQRESNLSKSLDQVDSAPSTDRNEPAATAAQRPKKSETDRIASIALEADALLPRIEAFSGPRNDREFLYLDEMLTRLLLKLDDVIVDGREDVRQARKEAIASIQNCINRLEAKIHGSANVTVIAIGDQSVEPVVCSPRHSDSPPPVQQAQSENQISVIEISPSREMPIESRHVTEIFVPLNDYDIRSTDAEDC